MRRQEGSHTMTRSKSLKTPRRLLVVAAHAEHDDRGFEHFEETGGLRAPDAGRRLEPRLGERGASAAREHRSSQAQSGRAT
jgi:hypothetical protein